MSYAQRITAKFNLLHWISIVSVLAVLQIQASSQTYEFTDNWGPEGLNLLSQSSLQVELVYSMHELNVLDINLSGEIMQNLALTGVVLPNNPGAPNLPVLSQYIAIPQGAQAQVEIIDFRVEIIPNLNLAPAFVIPIDTDLSPLHYEKDPQIYNENELYPAQPVIHGSPVRIRGVEAVILSVTPFQYNPITHDLVVFKDLRLRIQFNGGNGHFGEDRLRSRWWDPILKAHLLNWESLPEVEQTGLRVADEDINVEYLIITPNDPAFVAWADTLKRWRNEQGISTGIATLSQIGGNDTTLIENFINNAYNNWEIPPVAVLLLSDYQAGGLDVYGITSANFCEYSTDNKFADVDGDYLPDMNFARICAQNYQQLQTIITKMLNYERYPVTNPNFYDHPVLAGGYQTDTWFIFCTEVLYGFLHNSLGRNPVREYGLCSAPPGSLWSTNVNTAIVLNYFGPNGLGYIPASPQYLTDWSGNAARISRDLSNGAFLMQYRDHGTTNGWNVPFFGVGEANSLTNSMPPYIFSIGCSTGRFNFPIPCFAEAMHRSQYGAVGLIAASAPTYSFVNDAFTWGLYDYMWPQFDPGHGAPPGLDPQLLPGFANVSGKYYLEASSWPCNPASKWFAYQYFHHHGDAFMTLYSQPPESLSVFHDNSIAPGATLFAVNAEPGSWIALSVNGALIASAAGAGFPVLIPMTPLSFGQSLRVTVTRANHYRYSAVVPTRTVGPNGMTISLAPWNNPILIPPGGGSFSFYVLGTNSGPTPQIGSVWSQTTLPNGQTFGPSMFQGNVNFSPGTNSMLRVQFVPGYAVPGTYSYSVYIGQYPNTIWAQSSLTFEKLPEGSDSLHSQSETITGEFAAPSVQPNPFNLSTVITYHLPVECWVRLQVYDTGGRLIAVLADGMSAAGDYQATFQAPQLPSGVYLYRLFAGNESFTGKIVLLK